MTVHILHIPVFGATRQMSYALSDVLGGIFLTMSPWVFLRYQLPLFAKDSSVSVCFQSRAELLR